MANQPKKYKKFVATAATATLVASAIVPVASAASFSDIAGNTHADAIKSLADQGIVNGYADGTFKPNTEINRGQTVKLLGRWLETQGYDIPADWDTKQRFNDLPVTAEAELVKYAALVKDAGVFNGSNGNLNYNQPMQRQQMAVVLVRAIDTVLDIDLVEEYKEADFTTSVKDLEKAFSAENREAIVALEYAGITVVENFNPANTVTRGQFASFLYRTIELEEKEEVVDGVQIAKGQVFDDDTDKQFIRILLDGKAVTAQELITEGYTVEFEATDRRSGGSPAEIFKGGETTSTTGELSNDIDLEDAASVDYYVTVTLTKGSEVLTAPNTKITIKNLDSEVSKINDAVFVVKSSGDYASEFELTSSTLAAGDEAKLTELHATVNGTKEIVNLDGIESMYSVKSSDESVISVNKSDYTLTAEGPGTATITITYGGKTYTKKLTVKSEKRKIDTAKIDKKSLNVGVGNNATGTFKVQILDQYGDPVDADPEKDFSVFSSDENVAVVEEVEALENAKLEYKVTVKGMDTGSTVFTIRNAADNRIGNAITVNVTENVTVAKYTLTVDESISDADVKKVVAAGGTDATKNNISTSSTIDTGDQKYVKIDVKAFNSSNQELPAPKAVVDGVDGGNYKVTAINSSDTKVIDFVVAKDDYIIVKAGSNEGTVTITITDQNNTNVKKTITLKVTDKGVTITKVNFKDISTVNYATTLDYEDFLSYVKANDDSDTRITGLTLSRPYSQSVRLNEGTPAEAPVSNVDTLYVDLNGNGKLDADVEPIIGYVGMATTGDVYVGGSVNTATVKATDGFKVEAGSDGNVIFRVYNDKGEIVASKAVKVDF